MERNSILFESQNDERKKKAHCVERRKANRKNEKKKSRDERQDLKRKANDGRVDFTRMKKKS